MKDSAPKMTRRRFVKLGLTGIAAAPAIGLYGLNTARAEDLPHVSEDDPAAVALGYKHDISQVDVEKFPKAADGKICSDCQFFTGEPGAEWGPCAIFPGKAVNAKGWCNGFVAKV